MSQFLPVRLTHFRVAGEPKNWRWPRAICGARGAHLVSWADSFELREAAVVACERCMVVKDFWLSMPKRKPLTVRRWRPLLLKLSFGTVAP